MQHFFLVFLEQTVCATLHKLNTIISNHSFIPPSLLLDVTSMKVPLIQKLYVLPEQLGNSSIFTLAFSTVAHYPFKGNESITGVKSYPLADPHPKKSCQTKMNVSNDCRGTSNLAESSRFNHSVQ
ncbi:carbonic anhydrase-related protein 10-like [Platysternon megacephalum]|uniref:Carbonic anhydrase-related protein 10-like n=1 Tax=Platysternon megacephalum TaxID=55544 RepID=A0A4D9E5D4_9SAUR|nr:carbonic anhydrase-related protein 10-like [Platysternon megacephalum]